MTIAKICEAWAKTIPNGGDDSARKRWQSCNVYFDGKTIYSYGSHFPMAYILAPNLVWLNGDRFSVSTGNHQGKLRGAIASYAPDATVVIVPRTALEAAGVRYQTVAPVDVKPERWEYTLHTGDVAPAGMSTALTEHIDEYVSSTNWYACDDDSTECEQCFGRSYGSHHKIPRVTVYPAHDALLSMGFGTSGYLHSETNADTWADVCGYVNTAEGRQAVRRDPMSGEYRWHTARHWLGDCVFTAKRQRVNPRFRSVGGKAPYLISELNYYISSFDHQERRPLYFLSQLPQPADTVEQAIESLSPESVQTARDMGRNVVRQGDMFAIPMETTTRQLKASGATFAKRRVTVTLTPQAQQNLAVQTALRTVIGEAWGNVNRWSDNYDAWAEATIAKFREQFPNTVTPSRSDLVNLRDWQPSAWDKTRTVDASALYGTAHTATEVATLPDGRQYARGIMYHDPAVIGQTRAADHRRQKLGKAWHLIARNTVPVSGQGQGRRAA